MRNPAPVAQDARIDIEFSLALHLKTGKYFIGRDLIAANSALIARQRFWRICANRPPEGLAARVIGRLLAWEVRARVRSATFDRTFRRQRPSRPVLHMDPFTTLLHRLEARDLVLCHDVGPLTHSDLFDPLAVEAYVKAYAEIAAVGPHMVFDSVASRDAFHNLFKGSFASSRVIYPSLRIEVTTESQSPIAGVHAPFLLTVGSIGARKNQRRAIEAFALSGLATRGVQYVICGGREPGYEAAADLAAATPGVRLFGYVSDQVLSWLYANASGFILPSLLEGFGIPVAEAVARGLVPLVSIDSVLHEVAGDGALLVDPNDVGDIAAGMRQLVVMPEVEKAERRARLARSVARFSGAAFAGSWRGLIAEVAGAR